jgi:hypothetical protein
MPCSHGAVHASINVPPVQYDSAGQEVQTLLVVALQAVVSYLLAGQTAVQVALCVPPRQKCSSWQGVQARFVEFVHGVDS